MRPKAGSILLGSIIFILMNLACAGLAPAALKNQYFEKANPLGKEKMAGNLSLFFFKSEVAGTKIALECTANKLEGVEIEAAGKSTGTVKLTKCAFGTLKDGKPTPECTVTEPINFEFNDQLVEIARAPDEQDEFTPKTAPTFTTVEITGCAPFEAKYKIEGTYIASFNGVGENELIEHMLRFDSTGGNLKFGVERATIFATIDAYKRVNGKAWYAD